MRFAAAIFVLTATAVFTACSSYEEMRRLETRIEASVEKFHAQLNENRFGEIYAQADESLRGRESEESFTRRLAEVRGKTGAMSGKSIVIIQKGLGRDLRNLFSREETISHTEHTACDSGRAIERFEWKVRDGQVTLAGYELRQVFERGAIPVFGIGPGR